MNEIQLKAVTSPRLCQDMKRGGLRSRGGSWGRSLARQSVGGEASMLDHIWARTVKTWDASQN